LPRRQELIKPVSPEKRIFKVTGVTDEKQAAKLRTIIYFFGKTTTPVILLGPKTPRKDKVDGLKGKQK